MAKQDTFLILAKGALHKALLGFVKTITGAWQSSTGSHETPANVFTIPPFQAKQTLITENLPTISQVMESELQVRSGGDKLQVRTPLETGGLKIFDVSVGEINLAFEGNVVPDNGVGFKICGIYSVDT